MSGETSETESETITRTEQRTISGGGQVAYSIDGRHERQVRSVASKIETAIEMANARYFNQSPKSELGPKSANTEYELPAIRKAIEDANEDATFAKHIDGEMEYVVNDGYYPDDYRHYVDVTDIPPEDRPRAFQTAQANLCRHGYAINSLASNDEGQLTKFHVVSLAWIYDSRSYGRTRED